MKTSSKSLLMLVLMAFPLLSLVAQTGNYHVLQTNPDSIGKFITQDQFSRSKSPPHIELVYDQLYMCAHPWGIAIDSFRIVNTGDEALQFTIEVEYSNELAESDKTLVLCENDSIPAKSHYDRIIESDDILIDEDFSSGSIPTGWTINGQGQTNWNVQNTSFAGGIQPELCFKWNPNFTGQSFMCSPVINTSGIPEVLLSFTHMVDWFHNGIKVGVATRKDGGAWDIAWQIMPESNVGPNFESIIISDFNVGSENFQIAFFFEGDSYDIDYWYIDDVLLTEIGIPPPIQWLIVNPPMGTIIGGQSQLITTYLEAWELPEGYYIANVKIFSNDPVNPEISIPATGMISYCCSPAIIFNPDQIDVALVHGESSIDTLIIGNVGYGNLHFSIEISERNHYSGSGIEKNTNIRRGANDAGNVSNVGSSAETIDWLTVNPMNGIVPEDETIDVIVQCNTSNLFAGTYYANLVVTSNSYMFPEFEIPVTLQVMSCDLPPPQNLFLEMYSADLVHLEWQAPDFDEWIQWDDGTNYTAIGLAGSSVFSVASRFTPSQISQYDGKYLKEISFVPFEDDAGATYTLKVWKGENALTLLYSELLTEIIAEQWNSILLDPPVQIDGTQELWLGYEVNEVDGTYPAGTDDGPAIQGFGDKINYNGVWENLSAFGWDYNWNIAGRIDLLNSDLTYSQSGLHSQTLNLMPQSTEILSIGNIEDYPKTHSVFYKSVVIGYNVFQSPIDQNSFEKINPAIITNNYFDFTIDPQECFKFFVTAIYSECESDPSNVAYTPTVIPELLQVDGLNIFPNPVDDEVFIEARRLIRTIRLIDHLGKDIIVKKASSNKEKINVSGFSAGLYFILVETDGAVIIEKIIIR